MMEVKPEITKIQELAKLLATAILRHYGSQLPAITN